MDFVYRENFKIFRNINHPTGGGLTLGLKIKKKYHFNFPNIFLV